MTKVNIVVILILAIIVGVEQLKSNQEISEKNFFDLSSKGVKAIKREKNVCSIFSESNFMGREYHLIKGQYNRIDMKNMGIEEKDVASLKVKNGYAVIVFQKENFAGRKFLIKNKSFSLPNGFYKKINSLKVIKLESEYDLPIISYISNPIKEKSNIYIKGSNFKSDDIYVSAINKRGENFEFEVKQMADKYIILENNLKAGKYYITVNSKNNISNEYELNIISKENEEPIIKFIKKASKESENLFIRGLNFKKDISKVVALDNDGRSNNLDVVAINKRLIMVKNTLKPGKYSVYIENDNFKSKIYKLDLNINDK